MDCLTKIAIEDTKHDNCGFDPCRDCAQTKHTVWLSSPVWIDYNVYYGTTRFNGHQTYDVGYERALEVATKLAKVVGQDNVHIKSTPNAS